MAVKLEDSAETKEVASRRYEVMEIINGKDMRERESRGERHT